MSVRYSGGLVLAMLLAIAPVGQAKTLAKVDAWAKRVLHRATQSTILKSQQAVVGAVGIAMLSCGNMACEKVQQPMMDSFTRSSDPNVGFNIGFYNTYNDFAGSYHAASVDRTDSLGAVASNVAIPINFHSRLDSFGDFRLSIDDGLWRRNIYGVIESTGGGSFTIYDAHGSGSSIGSGVHASDHIALTFNSDGDVALSAKIYNPQVDVASDSIKRTIEIEVSVGESGEMDTFSAQADWIFSLSSTLVNSPENLLMPSYQQIASAWGRSDFASKLGEMGLAANQAVHNSLRTNIYTASDVSGRKRLRKSGGITQYWDEGSFSGVGVRLTVRDNSANVSLTKGYSSQVAEIPIGGTVTLGSGFETHNWMVQLGELAMDSNGYYRTLSLSAIATSEFRPFNFIGIHVDQSSQYYIDNAQLSWNIGESLTASGW